MQLEALVQATLATPANALKYLDHLNEGMERFKITSQRQKAAFIGGTLPPESTNLSKVEESFYYKDAAYLASVYPRVFKTPADAAPYTRNHAMLANMLYKGYHGRGLIQLTWLDNYIACSQGLGFPYVEQPDLLLQPWHAAMSACWYWDWKKCNEPADRGDMDEVALRVNGKARMHLAERKAGYARAMKVVL